VFRRRSLRFRIAFGYIGGALLVSGIVAGATYGITSNRLTTQRKNAAITRSKDAVAYINEYYASTRANRSADELLSLLQSRIGGDVLFVTGRAEKSSAVNVSQKTIPRQLRSAVAAGHVAYVTFGSPRKFIFGTQLPNNRQIYAYFVYKFTDLDTTLSLLRNIFVGVVAFALALAGAVGLRLADRTIRPLRAASEAAQLVAKGHLDTRLEESSEDELGRLARSFNQMAQSLGERIARERQFVSDASHELRTPLTALKTSVDYVADRASDLPPKLASAIGLAAGEVRALQRLVSDLLELTRAEAGGAHVMKEDLDLVAFAHEVVRRRAPETPVAIVGPDDLIVQTDKARLERVVGNLVENAVVHGEGREISIELSENNGHAVINVTDRGPGIAEGQVQRIFERFWRGDASRHRHERVGAGLGLAIARENAGLIGAELRVESTPGVGTTFEVRVPAEEEDGQS
jgi:two-component system, OmpR family, sensor histidine kinase MtrB